MSQAGVRPVPLPIDRSHVNRYGFGDGTLFRTRVLLTMDERRPRRFSVGGEGRLLKHSVVIVQNSALRTTSGGSSSETEVISGSLVARDFQNDVGGNRSEFRKIVRLLEDESPVSRAADLAFDHQSSHRASDF